MSADMYVNAVDTLLKSDKEMESDLPEERPPSLNVPPAIRPAVGGGEKEA